MTFTLIPFMVDKVKGTPDRVNQKSIFLVALGLGLNGSAGINPFSSNLLVDRIKKF